MRGGSVEVWRKNILYWFIAAKLILAPEKFCKQNNQLLTKSHVELEDNSTKVPQ